MNMEANKEDPLKQLVNLRKFYSNRSRDILSFYVQNTYNDTDYKKRFNSYLLSKKRPEANFSNNTIRKKKSVGARCAIKANNWLELRASGMNPSDLEVANQESMLTQAAKVMNNID